MLPTKPSAYQRFLQATLMRVRPNTLAAWLKPLLGVKRQLIKTPQGSFWIDPVSLLGIALTKYGIHEEDMVKTQEEYLRPECTFVDLGANEGYFTVIGAGLCGSAGHVLAIEPQRRLLPVIEENLRLNASPHVRLVNAAVGDQPGTSVIHLTASTNTGGSGFHRHSKYALPTQEVTVMTLEQVLDSHKISRVDLMKVDIEGHEYEALMGSPQVFESHRIRAVALELHPAILAKRGKDVSDITSMLKRFGYQHSSKFGNAVWVALDL